MRRIFIFWFLLLLFFATAGTSPQLASYPILESAHCGIVVKSLGGGEYVKKYQNNKSFTPASVMKLVTTATALETLGSDFRYMTKLEYRGNIVNGVLFGDLIIKGDGDPTLGSSYFYDNPSEFLDIWVREVEVLGIDSIAGSIVSDASVFDQQVIPDKWIWEDIGNYYGAGCFGLSCFDNRYRLYFVKTASGAIAEVDSVRPYGGGLSFESHVRAEDSNDDNAYIYGSPWHFYKRIYGTIPADREAFMIKGALPNPPLVLADLLKTQLALSGISVAHASQVQWEADAGVRSGISIWFSPPLSAIVRVANKESNNLFAEHLLKSTVMQDESPATLSSAIDAMAALWTSYGIGTEGVKMYDGSGMSRATLLTPDFVVDIIDYMTTSVHQEAFYASLAISGVDGTFKYFLDGTELQGRVYGKSGTMSGVRCYAGIIKKSTEEQYSFCIMVNNFTVSSAEVRRAIESYLLDLFK